MHFFFQTILYRREPSDEVAYWVLVHDEAGLKILDSSAPFKGTNLECEKEQWLNDNRDRIRDAYMAKLNRPPVITLLQC